MFELINGTQYYVQAALSDTTLLKAASHFAPFILLFELPLLIVILIGILYYQFKKTYIPQMTLPYHPKVSCILTCYSEDKKDLQQAIKSIAEQLYPGHIEIIPVVDGSSQNHATLAACNSMKAYVEKLDNRTLIVAGKPERSGRVSSLNTGCALSSGDIVMVLDGDSSCDNDAIAQAVQHFSDPNVAGVSGAIRVRNAKKNLVTRLQNLEYMLGIHASKVGFDALNAVNNISGAFGFFRRSFLENVGAWKAGSAEDLDLTVRIKSYFGRNKHLRIKFEPKSICHTDVPETWTDYFKQRLRWDGDLFYIYIRKHRHSFSPRLFGWKNFILMLWTGVLFQLILPLAIIAYTTFIFYKFSAEQALGILGVSYVYYLFSSTLLFLTFITILSERKKEDIKSSLLLPIVPIFNFLTRVWAGIATLGEIFTKSHQDSNMAPWWVMKRSKY